MKEDSVFQKDSTQDDYRPQSNYEFYMKRVNDPNLNQRSFKRSRLGTNPGTAHKSFDPRRHSSLGLSSKSKMSREVPENVISDNFLPHVESFSQISK